MNHSIDLLHIFKQLQTTKNSNIQKKKKTNLNFVAKKKRKKRNKSHQIISELAEMNLKQKTQKFLRKKVGPQIFCIRDFEGKKPQNS